MLVKSNNHLTSRLFGLANPVSVFSSWASLRFTGCIKSCVVKPQAAQLQRYIHMKYISVIIVLLLSYKAHACSCMPFDEGNSWLKHENIVIGKVIRLNENADKSSYLKSLIGDVVVTEVFKGSSQGIAKLYGAPKTHGNCSHELSIGKYIIYANLGNEPTITTCSAIRKLTEENESEIRKTLIKYQTKPPLRIKSPVEILREKYK